MTITVGQQAAWQTTSMLVDAAEKKAKEVGRAVLVAGSPSRNAVLTCIESGYQAGRSLATSGRTTEWAKRRCGSRGK